MKKEFLILIFLIALNWNALSQNTQENKLDEKYTPPLSLSQNMDSKIKSSHNDEIKKNSININPTLILSRNIFSVSYFRIIGDYFGVSVGLGKSFGLDKSQKMFYEFADIGYMSEAFNNGEFYNSKLYYELNISFLNIYEKTGVDLGLYYRNYEYNVKVNSNPNYHIKQGSLISNFNYRMSGLFFSYLFTTGTFLHQFYFHIGLANLKYNNIDLDFATNYYNLASTQSKLSYFYLGAGYILGINFK